MPNRTGLGKEGGVNDQDNISAKGRWDYLPWYWTDYDGTVNGPVPNPLYGTGAQPKENPGTPSPSVATNAFHDTMLVNGTAYPYLPVERKAYRLRILNACGDRQLNLQLYYAISDQVTRTGADGAPELQTESGDVSMLPAQPPMKGGWPARWPTDTRRGGVPDPRAVGPAMIQIGNDGGLLPQAATVRPTPVGLETRFPTDQEASMGEYPSIIAIGTKALYLAPGERADVIVDFSRVPAGSKLILYNDAPAPAPNADSRVDYYTTTGTRRPSGAPPRPSPATDPTRARSCSSRWTVRPRRRSTSSAFGAPSRPPTWRRRIPCWCPPRPTGTPTARPSGRRDAGRARPRTMRCRWCRRRSPARSRSRPWAARTG